MIALDHISGRFVRPNWPTSCLPESTCTVVPSPPSADALPSGSVALQRADDRTAFRDGESAYFTCVDLEGVIDDDSGSSVYAVVCSAEAGAGAGGGAFVEPPTWPACVVEPTCGGLPVPDAGSGLVKATKGDKVKLGERAVYECEKRAEFYETEQVKKTNCWCRSCN